MPLFIRSLPLSLGTLWHYIFLLPVVLVFSMPFIFLSLLPFLGLVISTGLTAFITITSYRCALTAYGKGNEPDIVKLVKSSLALGFGNMFAGMMALIVAVAFAIVLSWFGIGTDPDTPGADVIPMVPASAFALYLVLIMCFHCAMAVPTTALAHAATDHGRDPGLIFGFGQGFFSVLAAWVLWIAAFFFSCAFTVLVEAATTGLQMLFGGLLKIEETEIKPIRIIPLVLSTAMVLWGPCWFSATAVLAWDRAVKRREEERVKVVQVSRVSPEELRAMREARMPGGGTPH